MSTSWIPRSRRLATAHRSPRPSRRSSRRSRNALRYRLDVNALNEIAVHFRGGGATEARTESRSRQGDAPQIRTLLYQIPGGMYSNLIKQLTDQGAGGKLEEVLRKCPACARTSAIRRS